MEQNNIKTYPNNINNHQIDYSDCKGCEKGIGFCKRPCWPIPEEAQRLIDEGYGDKLMLDFWGSGGEEENIYILAPANPGYESKLAPGSDPFEFVFSMLLGRSPLSSGCTFQTPDNLCSLHDKGLKPFEGRRTCCKNNGSGLHEAVAREWDNEEAKKIVSNWKEKFLKN